MADFPAYKNYLDNEIKSLIKPVERLSLIEPFKFKPEKFTTDKTINYIPKENIKNMFKKYLIESGTKVENIFYWFMDGVNYVNDVNYPSTTESSSDSETDTGTTSDSSSSKQILPAMTKHFFDTSAYDTLYSSVTTGVITNKVSQDLNKIFFSINISANASASDSSDSSATATPPPTSTTVNGTTLNFNKDYYLPLFKYNNKNVMVVNNKGSKPVLSLSSKSYVPTTETLETVTITSEEIIDILVDNIITKFYYLKYASIIYSDGSKETIKGRPVIYPNYNITASTEFNKRLIKMSDENADTDKEIENTFIKTYYYNMLHLFGIYFYKALFTSETKEPLEVDNLTFKYVNTEFYKTRLNPDIIPSKVDKADFIQLTEEQKLAHL